MKNEDLNRFDLTIYFVFNLTITITARFINIGSDSLVKGF